MLWILRWMRDEGKYLHGRPITNPPHFFLGAAASPFSSNPKFQALREQKKVNAGAQFFQTNLIFDVEGMEAANVSGSAQEEGVQIALELIGRIKTYHQQGIRGIHMMPVGWDEIVPRIVVEAGLWSTDFLFNNTSQEWNNAHHFEGH